MNLTADTRSSIFGLFVVADRALTAGELIALAAPLGITATNVKSHLTRMVANGALTREGPARLARYAPTADQLDIVRGVSARLSLDRSARWNGQWIMLAVDPPDQRALRDRLAASLWFDGFRALGGGVFTRPDWPGGRWRERALEHADGGGVVIGGAALAGEERLCGLYDLDGLEREARALATEIRAIRPTKSPARAFAASMRVDGDIARLVGHDPMLPREIWGGRRGFADLIRAHRDFHKWADAAIARFVDGVLEGQA